MYIFTSVYKETVYKCVRFVRTLVRAYKRDCSQVCAFCADSSARLQSVLTNVCVYVRTIGVTLYVHMRLRKRTES